MKNVPVVRINLCIAKPDLLRENQLKMIRLAEKFRYKSSMNLID